MPGYEDTFCCQYTQISVGREQKEREKSNKWYICNKVTTEKAAIKK